MNRNQLAKYLGYEDEKAMDKELADPEYMAYIKRMANNIGKAYALGSLKYDGLLTKETEGQILNA